VITVVAVAVVTFVVTNLDDLVVLTAFCSHERYRLREVLLGQYLGFGTLVAASLIAGAAVASLLEDHVRWLGLLPVGVGLLWYANARRGAGGPASNELPIGERPRSRIGVVAGIGIADGGDNVGVYVPLFAAVGTVEAAVVVRTFLVTAGVWVLLARWLAARPTLAGRLEEHGDVAVPAVLVGLGLAVLAGLV
jgi:cadmium resistance protein CadD (predicted permease)